ncbi:glycosyltransferase family 9 protein [candidate division KSB1 bacterium]|nr:glycosyltransferase family 9 protein [candidate division KSB1 bacterium]
MRIVGLLFKRIGDSFMAQPALRALKRMWPESQIAVIAERQAARVFEGLAYVDEIRMFDSSATTLALVRLLRQSGAPDIVLDFMANPRTALVTLLSGAPQRVGIAYRWRGWVYTSVVAVQDRQTPSYSAIHKLGLARALGAAATDHTTEFRLRESDVSFADAEFRARGMDGSAAVVAFFVHSRRPYKRWAGANYAELIRRTKDSGLARPLLLHTPGDDDSVREVETLARLDADETLSVGDLGQLGAVLKRCRLLVGNDGGPKHLAVAVGTRTVTLFGTEPPEYWTPPDASRHAALTAGIGREARGTLDAIAVDQVLSEIRARLDGTSS